MHLLIIRRQFVASFMYSLTFESVLILLVPFSEQHFHAPAFALLLLPSSHASFILLSFSSHASAKLSCHVHPIIIA